MWWLQVQKASRSHVCIANIFLLIELSEVYTPYFNQINGDFIPIGVYIKKIYSDQAWILIINEVIKVLVNVFSEVLPAFFPWLVL